MSTSPTASHLVFEVDATRYALPLASLVEVARRVRITPLPAAPPIVLGMINHRGAAVAAIDLRERLGRGRRAATIEDQLVVVRTARRTLALVVDRVSGVEEELAEDVVAAAQIDDRHVRGVAVVEGGLVLVHDVEALLSSDEDRALNEAIDGA